MELNEDYIFNGKFGIERETLRVTKDYKLSQTLHPFTNKHLSKDFCENQLEIITPVCESVETAYNSLKEFSEKAENKLVKMGERLWLYSNPPHFNNEDDIRIAEYSGELGSKHDYRVNLQRRYGKKLMLYSGIHFNFSFDKKYLNGNRNEKDNFYLKLLKHLSVNSWLLTMLTASSPVYDKSLESDGECGNAFKGYGSMRSGEYGYWNQFVPILDYSSIQSFCKSVKNYINKGALFSEGELYLPIRIKSKGENSLDSLVESGVDHIELRMFDLNPLSPNGIFLEDLEFAHIFIVYLSQKDDFDFNEKMQIEAIKNHKNSAKYDLSDVQIDGQNIVIKATEILNDMKAFFKDNKKAEKIINYQINKLIKKRYAEIIYTNLMNEDTLYKGELRCVNYSEQV